MTNVIDDMTYIARDIQDELLDSGMSADNVYMLQDPTFWEVVLFWDSDDNFGVNKKVSNFMQDYSDECRDFKDFANAIKEDEPEWAPGWDEFCERIGVNTLEDSEDIQEDDVREFELNFFMEREDFITEISGLIDEINNDEDYRGLDSEDDEDYSDDSEDDEF